MGLTIFPRLHNFLTDFFQWRGAFLILAGLTLHLCPIGLCVPEPPALPKSATNSKFFHRLHLDLFKSPKFILVFLGTMVVQSAGITIGTFIYHIFTHHYHLGMDSATLLTGCFGLASILGQAMVALIKESKRIPRWFWWSLDALCFGIAQSLIGVFTSYLSAIILQCVGGLCIGLYFTMIPVVLADLFDVDRLPATFGYTLFSCGIGSLIGPLFGGKRFCSSKWLSSSERRLSNCETWL